jgi:solute carrier family 13 (sodium-dependent dicarboxylate transporter), member 2/3/5
MATHTPSAVAAASTTSTGTFFSRWRDNVVASGRKKPATTLIGFAVAWFAFFFILWLMPLPQGMSPAGKATLAIMVWACIMWITEAIPVGISGLLIPALLVLTEAVRPFSAAAGGFVTPVMFLCLSAFLFAAIMQAAGLDRRIALSLLKWTKAKTVNGVIWAMFGVTFILSFIIPAANSRAATMLPVINGITRFFGDTETERNAKKAIVIQALVYGSMISGMCILTAHLPNIVLVGLFEKQGLKLSYFDWFIMQWPYLGMFVLTQWWVQWYFKTKGVGIQGGLQTIERQHAELPRANQSEWLVLVIFGVIAAMWMFEKQTGIASHNAALIGLALLFIPGVFHFPWKDIQDRTIWGTLLLLAGALSLSDAIGKTGLAQWFSDIVHPIAQGHTWWMILLILMVGTHIIRLGMLSNIAAVAMIAPILIALAPKLGLHPVAFTMLVADTDSFAYILPTQITAAVIAYSTGVFSAQDYAKVGWVSVLIGIVYGICVMAPWYAFLGVPVWDPTAPWPFGTIQGAK